MSSPEPWLRGPIQGVHPLVMPVFFSFAQVREDLTKYTAAVRPEAVWQEVNGSSFGFHLRHIGGSVDRLTTYLFGQQLNERQLEALRHEGEPKGTLPELLEDLERALARSEERLRTLDPDTLYDARSVGRRALPTTVIGLIVHLCEHTQRHLGQAITLAKTLGPA
jgi:uncharacterized damage-inducible protein DinB